MQEDADLYRRYWSAVTDRSERDVYVPHALRTTRTLRVANMAGTSAMVTLEVDGDGPGWVSGTITSIRR